VICFLNFLICMVVCNRFIWIYLCICLEFLHWVQAFFFALVTRWRLPSNREEIGNFSSEKLG
jgi:hypothetical protein